MDFVSTLSNVLIWYYILKQFVLLICQAILSTPCHSKIQKCNGCWQIQALCLINTISGYTLFVVLLLIDPPTYCSSQQEMVRQKFHSTHFMKLFYTMQFNSLIVINVYPILLSYCKHGFNMQPRNVINLFHNVYFAVQLLCYPVESCHMTSFTTQQQMTSVTGVLGSIRSKVV